MSGVDTVVSGAVSGCLCDIHSVSRGDIVARVGEMSLSGGGGAVVSGVDESVCGVNSVLADGILDLCGIDKLVSDVDEPECDVSSVMSAGELDVCGCDSLVSDGAGDSSGVEVVDDVVACGDDILLSDAFRVGGWLSVVGLGVTRPGWVCADESLRPSHRCTQCVCVVVYWQLPVYRDILCIRLAGYPCRYLFALYSVLYFYFVYFITGTADRESWEGCHGQRFCIIFLVLFLIIYGVCFIVRRAPGPRA